MRRWWVVLWVGLWAFSAYAGPKEDANAKKKAGDKLLAEGDVTGALQAYEEAKALFPDPEFELSRGEALLKLRRYQEARAAYEAYLSATKNPKHKSEVQKAIQALDQIDRTSLTCESDPLGATVYVNSRLDGEVGPTPVTFNLPPGTHRIMFEKAGFRPAVQLITIKEGDKSSLKVKLEVAPYVVDVATSPSNAEIFVDGQPQGKSPSALELSEGPHTLELKLAGFQTLTKKVEGKAGEKQQLSHTFEESPSQLLVKTNPPSEGTFEVTGKGLTGKIGEVLSIPAGKYNVIVRPKGYKEVATVATVEKTKQAEVSVNVEALPVRLVIRSNVPGFTTIIDNTPQATAGDSFELPPGKHAIKVEATGMRPYEGEIELKPGEPVALEVSLRYPRRTSTLAIGGGGAGLALLASGFGIGALRKANQLQEDIQSGQQAITPENCPDFDPTVQSDDNSKELVKCKVRLSGARPFSITSDLLFLATGGALAYGGYRYLTQEGPSTAKTTPLPVEGKP